jgi:hypothetical protein
MKAGLGRGLLNEAVTMEGMTTLLYLRASETGMSSYASRLILESGFHQLPDWYGQASIRLICRHAEQPCIQVLVNWVRCQSEEMRKRVASRFSLSLSIISSGECRNVVRGCGRGMLAGMVQFRLLQRYDS